MIGGVMPLAKLSSKSQIVLPAQIRRHLNIKPGDTLDIREEDQRIVIIKPPTSIVDALDNCDSEIWKEYASELLKSRQEWDK